MEKPLHSLVLSQKGIIDNIVNKVMEYNFSNLQKETPIQKLKTHRTTNRQDQKRNIPHYVTFKTLNIHN